MRSAFYVWIYACQTQCVHNNIIMYVHACISVLVVLIYGPMAYGRSKSVTI